jgi:Uma2 family endonuclease
MPAMPVAQQMTADEFVALPVPEHGRPWNLIDGGVVVSDPNARHGHAQGALFTALTDWIRTDAGHGHVVFPRDIGIDNRNVFVPDVLWYARGRLPDPDSPAPYAISDLAIEVRSPSTWRHDRGPKKAGYERRGLPELWLIDTVALAVLISRRSRPDAATFDIELELEPGDDLTSPMLPGFELAVTDVFRVM